MADRFYIGPYDENSGLRTDLEPFVIPEQAFSDLTNAYVFRGRVRKRFGTRWMGASQLNSRLGIPLPGGPGVGTTDGAGNATGTVPAGVGTIGDAFSIGGELYTVNVANGPMLDTGNTPTATFNTATGVYNFVGATPATQIIYYIGLPVMGIIPYEQANIDQERIIAFDTNYAYEFVNGSWSRLAAETNPGDATWTGNDSQFFWGVTYSGTQASDKVLFVTNFNQTEPNFLRYFFNNTWTGYRPVISVAVNAPPVLGITLDSCLLFVIFQNRLIALNTWENETPFGGGSTLRNYTGRARWTWPNNPLDATAWRQDLPGHGQFADATTSEAIVTAQFVKNHLIVFFERSTWELVYTGNEVDPFRWQQLNTELGSESTYSIVPFDKICLGIAQVGIHACNGSNVERIDSSIPDFIFQVNANFGGQKRVHGIRDYAVEQVYWTMADQTRTEDNPYPNQVLVYNYKTGTWAINDDSITVFGYLNATNTLTILPEVTWDSDTVTWDMPVSWDGTGAQGSSVLQQQQVIGGNQQGYVFVVDANMTYNAPLLQITDLTYSATNLVTVTCIEHNLDNFEFVLLTGITSKGAGHNLEQLNYTVVQILVLDDETFTFPATIALVGTYSGGGQASRVSRINIRTKEFNLYSKEGRNANINKVEFLVDSTFESAIGLNYYTNSNTQNIALYSGPIGTQAMLGTNNLDLFPYSNILPYEQEAQRLWHPVYFQADGEFIQLQLIQTDNQLKTLTTTLNGDGSTSFTGPGFEDFQMHAMILYAKPTGRLQ